MKHFEMVFQTIELLGYPLSQPSEGPHHGAYISVLCSLGYVEVAPLGLRGCRMISLSELYGL